MRRTNAYLKAQGFDFRLGFSQGQNKNVIIAYRYRPYLESLKKHYAWLKDARYSIGRFKATDLKDALIKPKRRGLSGPRTLGWQKYSTTDHYSAFTAKLNFKLPVVSPEQAEEIMTLILLDKISKR